MLVYLYVTVQLPTSELIFMGLGGYSHFQLFCFLPIPIPIVDFLFSFGYGFSVSIGKIISIVVADTCHMLLL